MLRRVFKVSLKKISAAILMLFAINILAEDLQVKVFSTIKTTQRMNAELYFDITQYEQNSLKAFNTYQIPEKPKFWPINATKAISEKNITSFIIKANEKIKTLYTLIEYDGSSFAIDDHLGSVELIAENISGEIGLKWNIPNLQDQTDIKKLNDNVDEQKFLMSSEDGIYEVKFKVLSSRMVN